MKVSVIASANAPEAAQNWIGTVYVKDWADLGALLETMCEEFPRVLIRNEHGAVSVEIQS